MTAPLAPDMSAPDLSDERTTLETCPDEIFDLVRQWVTAACADAIQAENHLRTARRLDAFAEAKLREALPAIGATP